MIFLLSRTAHAGFLVSTILRAYVIGIKQNQHSHFAAGALTPTLI